MEFYFELEFNREKRKIEYDNSSNLNDLVVRKILFGKKVFFFNLLECE